MPPPLLIDPDQLDYDHPLVDRDGIRKVNPQRFEMEQLDGIAYLSFEEKLIVGFKNVRSDEFWVRGHMPQFPLLPGVLMCEAAAQLCSYYITTAGLLSGDFLAFGGMEDVKFRGAVRPGDRFVIASRLRDLRPGRLASWTVQGIVGKTLVFQCVIIGVPFTRESSTRTRIDGPV